MGIYADPAAGIEKIAFTHNKVTVTFSVPAPGRHWCRIRGRNIDSPDDAFRTLYGFYLNETVTGGDLLPIEKLELIPQILSE